MFKRFATVSQLQLFYCKLDIVLELVPWFRVVLKHHPRSATAYSKLLIHIAAS